MYAVDKDGKEQWSFEPEGVVPIGQVLARDRVLVAFGSPSRLAELDSKGKAVWSKELRDEDPSPVRAVQRLPDGSTFFAQSLRIVQIDPKGKETVLHRREWVGTGNLYEIAHARKLPDGNIALLTADAVYRLLDGKGKELKSFGVGKQDDFGGAARIAVLADGSVLVSKWQKGAVEKFDAEGKLLWRADVETPSCLQPLPDGGVLVGSATGECVVELSPKGKLVRRVSAGAPVSWVGR